MDLHFADLDSLPANELARWLVEVFGQGLDAAVQTARNEGMPSPLARPETLASAIAWGLHHRDGAAFGNVSPDALVRPVLERLRLVDLAWSIACEQRAQWDDPQGLNGIPDRSAERQQHSEDSIAAVLGAHSDYVVGTVVSRMQCTSEQAEQVVADAWADMFRAYWSPTARARFVGLCTIRTLACTLALRGHCRQQKYQRRQPLTESDLFDDSGENGHGLVRNAAARPSTPDHPGELLFVLEDCIGRLPPKQALISHMKLVRDVRESDIAITLGCSRPAITQSLNASRPKLQDCLRAKGFGPDQSPAAEPSDTGTPQTAGSPRSQRSVP